MLAVVHWWLRRQNDAEDIDDRFQFYYWNTLENFLRWLYFLQILTKALVACWQILQNDNIFELRRVTRNLKQPSDERVISFIKQNGKYLKGASFCYQEAQIY